MKKPWAVIIIIVVFLSGCASQTNSGYSNTISSVKTQNGVVSTPQLRHPYGQLQPYHDRQGPYVYRNSSYTQVNSSRDLVGYIVLMVFCVVMFGEEC